MIEWKISAAPIDYPEAIQAMEARVGAIIAHEQPEQIWLLEHPPLYTAGTSAKPEELLIPDALPIYPTGRGGKYTYHGTGQRIGYVMLNLTERGLGIREYLTRLEEWLIASLASFGITARADRENVGIWVGDAKIAAIGIRIRKGVSYHGFCLNVSPNLAHYEGIVPCGLVDKGVVSMQTLGVDVEYTEVDKVLHTTFSSFFT